MSCQVGQVLDLLGEGEINGILTKFAGVADRLQHSRSPIFIALDQRDYMLKLIRTGAEKR